ncbi:hypothetical protein GCM10010302_10280 [Streptomyces polychromogenes]|uniref:Uncharacterized protein n=1 Tax=Streptomyces polychromogenes TaxID=67342 RepID=A0ABN0V4A1_9ACTN
MRTLLNRLVTALTRPPHPSVRPALPAQDGRARLPAVLRSPHH